MGLQLEVLRNHSRISGLGPVTVTISQTPKQSFLVLSDDMKKLLSPHSGKWSLFTGVLALLGLTLNGCSVGGSTAVTGEAISTSGTQEGSVGNPSSVPSEAASPSPTDSARQLQSVMEILDG